MNNVPEKMNKLGETDFIKSGFNIKSSTKTLLNVKTILGLKNECGYIGTNFFSKNQVGIPAIHFAGVPVSVEAKLTEEVQKIYYKNPDALAEDLYDNKDLGKSILVLNNMETEEDFVVPNIRIIPPDYMKELVADPSSFAVEISYLETPAFTNGNSITFCIGHKHNSFSLRSLRKVYDEFDSICTHVWGYIEDNKSYYLICTIQDVYPEDNNGCLQRGIDIMIFEDVDNNVVQEMHYVGLINFDENDEFTIEHDEKITTSYGDFKTKNGDLYDITAIGMYPVAQQLDLVSGQTPMIKLVYTIDQKNKNIHLEDWEGNDIFWISDSLKDELVSRIVIMHNLETE